MRHDCHTTLMYPYAFFSLSHRERAKVRGNKGILE